MNLWKQTTKNILRVCAFVGALSACTASPTEPNTTNSRSAANEVNSSSSEDPKKTVQSVSEFYDANCLSCHNTSTIWKETLALRWGALKSEDIRAKFLAAVASNPSMKRFATLTDKELEDLANLLQSAQTSDPFEVNLDGKKVHELFCKSCHGGAEAHAILLTERHGALEKVALRELIAEAATAVPTMAPIKSMLPEQLDAVASTLFTLMHSGGDEPPPPSVVGHQQLCSGCHGSSANHATVILSRFSTIDRSTLSAKTLAAVANVPDMSLLKNREASVISQASEEVFAEIEKIRSSEEPPPTKDGLALHGTVCASCHGSLAAHAQTLFDRHQNLSRNDLGTKTTAASASVGQMMFLETYEQAELNKILNVLAQKISDIAAENPDDPPPPAMGHQQLCSSCHNTSVNHAGVILTRFPTITKSDLQSKTQAAVNNVPDMSALKIREVAVINGAADEIFTEIEKIRSANEPPPPQDGLALHASACASCHGTLAVHAQTLFDRYQAISRANLGVKTTAASASITQMSFVTTYDAANLDKILNVLGQKIADIAAENPGGNNPPPASGKELWTQHCSGCHGGQEFQKSSATATSIKAAITTTIPQMAYLTSIDDPKIDLIAQYLNGFKVDVPLKKTMLLANRFQVSEQIRSAMAPAFGEISNYENIWRVTASPHIHGKPKLWGGNCNRNDFTGCVSSVYDQDEAYANPIGAPSPIRRGGLKAACSSMISTSNAVAAVIGVNGLNISAVNDTSVRKVFNQFYPAIPPTDEIVTSLINLGVAMEQGAVAQNTKWGVIMSLLCYSPLMEAL